MKCSQQYDVFLKYKILKSIFFFSSGFSRHLGSPLWLLIFSFQYLNLKIYTSDYLRVNGLEFEHNMQTRHNFVGEIRIFSVKIRNNPYPSFMHRCIAKMFTRFISRCSYANKSRHCVIKIDSHQNRSLASRCPTVGLGIRL